METYAKIDEAKAMAVDNGLIIFYEGKAANTGSNINIERRDEKFHAFSVAPRQRADIPVEQIAISASLWAPRRGALVFECPVPAHVILVTDEGEREIELVMAARYLFDGGVGD